MIASTVLAVFFVPVFYVLFQRMAEFLSKREGPKPQVVKQHEQSANGNGAHATGHAVPTATH